MMQVLDAGFGPDDRIGNYRVEHELGPTGSGVLLQARHQVLPRRAIIKVVHAAFAGESPYLVQTLREACILEAICHPGVPIVYESGLLQDRRPWFAFELIHGPTLEDLLVPRALPIPEVARLMRDLADILENAHRRGVIHRGLRPDRIVMTRHRRFPVCIPDWSEAIAHDASASVPPPDGSRAYVAPELAHQDAGGAERVDDRADMFALGAVAYRALTGTVPFNPVAANVPYLAARTRRPDTPRELATIIDSLLSVDRFDRPSASEVRTELEWLLGALPELQQHAASRAPDPDEDPPRDATRGGGNGPASPGPPPAAGNISSRSIHDIDVEGTPPVATSANVDVAFGPPRVRRPRWTPTVHYVEATDVDIIIDEDSPT